MAYLYVLRITGVGRVRKRNWKNPLGFGLWAAWSSPVPGELSIPWTTAAAEPRPAVPP